MGSDLDRWRAAVADTEDELPADVAGQTSVAACDPVRRSDTVPPGGATGTGPRRPGSGVRVPLARPAPRSAARPAADRHRRAFASLKAR